MPSDLYDHLKKRLETETSQDKDPETGVFGKLKKQLGADEPQQGIQPSDLVDLPRLQREVLLTILRDHQAVLHGITADKLRHDLKQPAHLEDTLDELTGSNWLVSMGEAPNVRYKIRLGARRGRGGDMWSAVAERLAKRDKKE
jgi:hypothetical protein